MHTVQSSLPGLSLSDASTFFADSQGTRVNPFDQRGEGDFLFLAVLVRLVQFRQQGFEHFGVVEQLGAPVDAEGEVELGQIPGDFAADSCRRDVRDVRQPVDECFGCECESWIGEYECAVRRGREGQLMCGLCFGRGGRELKWLTCG